MALARKSIKQRFHPSAKMLLVMESFRQMTNDCIRIGMEFEKESRRQRDSVDEEAVAPFLSGTQEALRRIFSVLTVRHIQGCWYSLSRRKSIRRGFHTKTPYLSQDRCSCFAMGSRWRMVT